MTGFIPGPESHLAFDRPPAPPRHTGHRTTGDSSVAQVLALIAVVVTVVMGLSLGEVPVMLLAAVLGLIPAGIAKSKGRDFGTWWAYGFLLFAVALVHSLVIKKA